MSTWRPGKFKDPLTSASFELDIQGECQGVFKECAGLGSESEVIEHKTAGGNGKVIIQKIPGNLKFTTIVLKRGVTDDMGIWTWRKKVEDGQVVDARKDGQIVMYNQADEPVARWNFTSAWPSKVSGPTLNAGTNDIAVEELNIEHEGMERVDP